MESFEYLIPFEIRNYPRFTTGRGEIFEEYIDTYISKMNELMDEAISSNTQEYLAIEAMRDNMVTTKERMADMDTKLDMLLDKVESDILTKEDNMTVEGMINV